MSDKSLMTLHQIQQRIFTIRGVQVMIDKDLAALYQVETRALNQSVKRNIERFPDEFMFQLEDDELTELNQNLLISQIVMSKENRGGRRTLPYAFTEQGISMLSAVLKSRVAIDISIQIINAFVEMRKFMNVNAAIFHRVENMERKQDAARTQHRRRCILLEGGAI